MKPDRRYVEQGRGGHVYFIGRRCQVCREAMAKKDIRIIWEIKNGWFRGDDDVYACHQKCEPGMAAAIPSNTKASE